MHQNQEKKLNNYVKGSVTMPDDDLDQILEELKNDESITSLNEAPSADKLDINDENVNDYVMQKVGRLVESGIETVEAIQQTIASGFSADELQAFSGLLNSVTSAAETLNKINIQNKKAAASKEIKEMDIASKKQISDGKVALGSGGQGGETNILIATREEVIERFLSENQNAIEVSVEEDEEEEIDETDE